MAMCGYFNTIGGDSVVDKLIVFGWKMVEAFLNDVISVEVFNERDDVEVQCDNETLNLTLGRQKINHLLSSTGPMHVERYRN